MSKHKLEYIWLDGYKPTQSPRGKTMMLKISAVSLKMLSNGLLTDLLLSKLRAVRPTACCNQFMSFRTPTVSAEMDGWSCVKFLIPMEHPMNLMAVLLSTMMMTSGGFEQEHTLIDLETDLPLGFPKGGYQGLGALLHCACNTKGPSL